MLNCELNGIYISRCESKHNKSSSVVFGSSHGNSWIAGKGEPHCSPQYHKQLLGTHLYPRYWVNAGIMQKALIVNICPAGLCPICYVFSTTLGWFPTLPMALRCSLNIESYPSSDRYMHLWERWLVFGERPGGYEWQQRQAPTPQISVLSARPKFD